MSNFEDGPTAVNGLVNFLYGKEANSAHGKGAYRSAMG
jgi:hypothetical protein